MQAPGLGLSELLFLVASLVGAVAVVTVGCLLALWLWRRFLAGRFGPP